ncbi:hypothetical protein [Rhodococcoides kyotonense]|uniref:Uncharacterized protein n=1 Tax=Rhodococcoides kyotonense TaxID=398843 RepID=A0A239FQX3_9NOCA|nr:hypothetical protein [Rhodococcus kyotonensis]SNS59230.1 hypothetical protein SAMN05421642_103414 [Rhodococcus kyotonensis]
MDQHTIVERGDLAADWQDAAPAADLPRPAVMAAITAATIVGAWGILNGLAALNGGVL